MRAQQLWSNPKFNVDETSDEFARINPSTVAMANARPRNDDAQAGDGGGGSGAPPAPAPALNPGRQPMTQESMYRFVGYLRLPLNFQLPALPCARNNFLNACRQAKQILAWRQTCMARLTYTAPQAAAIATRAAAFNALIQRGPFQWAVR